jgi:hypothetical protein
METISATLYALDILFLMSFQVLNRDQPMFSHAISDYGVGRTARLFKVYVIAGCIAAPLLAWQFWRSTAPAYPPIITVYLLLVSLGRLVLGLYPNDPLGAPRTTAGQLHHAGTLLAFCCAYMTVAEATPLLLPTIASPLSEILAVLRHVISIGFVAVVITISPPLRHYFGLAERIFLYATALWFLAASLTLPPI